MKLFEANHSLHLNGSLERRKGLEEDKETFRIMMSNVVTAPQSLPLNFSLSMTITPFEELFETDNQKVFTARIKFS